jgi:hypothetical protein
MPMIEMTYIINFGHRLSEKVLGEFQPCVEVWVRCPYLGSEVRPEILIKSVVSEAERRLSAVGGRLDGTVPLIAVLPGSTEAGVLLVAELSGRTGSLPRVLSLRRQEDGTFGLFGGTKQEGLLDLNRVRTAARGRR